MDSSPPIAESSPPAPAPPDAALTDEEIVHRIRGGEAALFEVLMRRHNPRLYRVARSILGSDAEVEDVMQEAYLNAYVHLGQFAAAPLVTQSRRSHGLSPVGL